MNVTTEFPPVDLGSEETVNNAFVAIVSELGGTALNGSPYEAGAIITSPLTEDEIDQFVAELNSDQPLSETDQALMSFDDEQLGRISLAQTAFMSAEAAAFWDRTQREQQEAAARKEEKKKKKKWLRKNGYELAA